MKGFYTTIAYMALAMLLGFIQPSLAATEKESIDKAKQLYAQASPMDISSPERARILDEAAAILNNVLNENPKSLDAHRKLMGVYLLKQDYSNAIRTMQSAITLSPEDPKLFISLAFLYEHSGALELAKGMLGQALKLDPDNKIAQDYKLVIQQKIDEFNAAHGQAQGASPHAGSSSPHGASPHAHAGSGSKLIDSKLIESSQAAPNSDAAAEASGK